MEYDYQVNLAIGCAKYYDINALEQIAKHARNAARMLRNSVEIEWNEKLSETAQNAIYSFNALESSIEDIIKLAKS